MEGLGWIHLADIREQCQALLNRAVSNLRI